MTPVVDPLGSGALEEAEPSPCAGFRGPGVRYCPQPMRAISFQTTIRTLEKAPAVASTMEPRRSRNQDWHPRESLAEGAAP